MIAIINNDDTQIAVNPDEIAAIMSQSRTESSVILKCGVVHIISFDEAKRLLDHCGLIGLTVDCTGQHAGLNMLGKDMPDESIGDFWDWKCDECGSLYSGEEHHSGVECCGKPARYLK